MGGSSRDPKDPSGYPWIYLRDGRAVDMAEPVVELIAVGDVLLGRGAAGEPDPFRAASPWLQSADLALANLESAMGPEAPQSDPTLAGPGNPIRLVAPFSSVALLQEAGFDLVGLANNHAGDRGAVALAEASTRLQASGIDVLGAGADAHAAFQPVIRETKGLRLAFLAFNAVPTPPSGGLSGTVRATLEPGGWVVAGWEAERAAAAVRSARSRADAVIVSIHWGHEYELRSDPVQRQAAETLMAAGADLVLGHHPHTVQETAVSLRKNGRPAGFVAYSLGNFVFDQFWDETRQGLALRALFDRRGLRAVQALPVTAGLRPALLPPHVTAELLYRFRPEPRSTGFTCGNDGSATVKDVGCRSADVPDPGKSGLFWSGQVDLTGDGTAEWVHREAGGVIIRGSDGAEAWRSPANWQVVDLATGDPNNDGRQELLLALLKPDVGGVVRSHPYLLGYRSGEYRLVWGGSAVERALFEVEVGDLDGDGRQELIVLDGRAGDAGADEAVARRAVSVWRWHGWGFIQDWRSPEGGYENLTLVDPGAGLPAAIHLDLR